MCPLVPTLKDYLLVPVTIHTICMVLFIPTKTVGTHAATCDRVVLVFTIQVIEGGVGSISKYRTKATILFCYCNKAIISLFFPA